MSGNTYKRQLLPNSGRIICDVEGQELLPNRAFRPFYNAEINPKFLTHPDYFEMIAARFSAGVADRELEGAFGQTVRNIYASSADPEEDYEDFEHLFYDYAYDHSLEPFRGDAGWKTGQRGRWQEEKDICDRLVEEEVPREYRKRAKVFAYLVILMWRRPLTDVVSNPSVLFKQWGSEKAIDISKEHYEFTLGRRSSGSGEEKFIWKLFYNGSDETASFRLRLPEGIGNPAGKQPVTIALRPGECVQAVLSRGDAAKRNTLEENVMKGDAAGGDISDEDVICSIRRACCCYGKNVRLVKEPNENAGGVRWYFQTLAENRRSFLEQRESAADVFPNERRSANDSGNGRYPAADVFKSGRKQMTDDPRNGGEQTTDVSFAWDGSVLQIKDGHICGLEPLGDEIAFPSVVRNAQKHGERFIQLYYTGSATAALTESGKLYCTNFSTDPSETDRLHNGKDPEPSGSVGSSPTGFPADSPTDPPTGFPADWSKPVYSVLEYEGELYYLIRDGAGCRLCSTADDLSAFLIDGMGEEESYWLHMAGSLKGESHMTGTVKKESHMAGSLKGESYKAESLKEEPCEAESLKEESYMVDPDPLREVSE